MTELLISQQHRANSVARIGPAILARPARQKVLPPPELATGFERRIVQLSKDVPTIHLEHAAIAPCYLNTLIEL